MNLSDNGYEMQGISVLDLSKKYGLPLFVYDAQKIKQQYQRLQQAFEVQTVRFNYACKALSNLSILRLMHSLGAGADVVSIGEIKLALHAGFKPEEIMYTPSSVSIQEYEEAIKLGVRINVDNIETLEYFGHHYRDQSICIRINPHVMAGGNKKISVGHIDSKFGISIHQIDKIRDLVDNLQIDVEGIHMHTGSDILDVDVFLAATDILFDVARKFPEITFIDFGSGFKVKYKEDDIETDIDLFGREMSKKFNAYCDEIGKEIELIFEPGKYL
ncbi:MAG: diaminopimelate decarboxylase, partial [Saprospiraceae bacterium]|nr:diaminopimelate decarboxylase [Saprospiraceae bacterium]